MPSRRTVLTGSALAVAATAAVLTPVMAQAPQQATGAATTQLDQSGAVRDPKPPPQTELRFKNSSVLTSVMVAQVPDGTKTGSENAPIVVAPGQSATFTHAEVTSTPEIRLRVYAAYKQGLTQRWIKGPLLEIVETLHNYPTYGARINLYSRASETDQMGKEERSFGYVDESARLDGHGQVCIVSRQSDDGPSRFRLTFEALSFTKATAVDNQEGYTPHPNP